MFRNPHPAMKRNFRRFAGICVLAAALPFFSACGLNELIYLYPIEDWRITQDGTANGLIFHHNTENGASGTADAFLGYEIFYKFYSASDSVAAMTAINADRTYFYQRYIASESTITAQGFQSLFRTGDIPASFSTTANANPVQRPARPFIFFPSSGGMSKGGAWTYLISFPIDIGTIIPDSGLTQDKQPVFRIFPGNDTLSNPESGRFYLYRPTTQQNSRKSFLPKTGTSTETIGTAPNTTTINYSYYVAGDSDLQRLSGYTVGNDLYVGICVVAYGRDPSNFSPLYSEAIVLNAGPAYPIYVRF
jgi:hypothetical protein